MCVIVPVTKSDKKALRVWIVIEVERGQEVVMLYIALKWLDHKTSSLPTSIQTDKFDKFLEFLNEPSNALHSVQ